MERTERYTILIYGAYLQNQEVDLKSIWAVYAAEEFKQSNLFIQATVDPTYLICDTDVYCERCFVACYRITCTRNPYAVPDSDDYIRAMTNIFTKLKVYLKDPYVSVEQDMVEISYFPPSKQ